MSNILVISCSLNPESNSRRLGRNAFEKLSKVATVDFVDLRDLQLPMCDGGAAYGHENVAPIAKQIKEAQCILLAVPIYNYDANAAAKNLVELTGRAWNDKVVGFLCAAGGKMSYMSVMSLANSLMLDFRCLVIPRFVYADKGHFDEQGIHKPEVEERIEELVATAMKLTMALQEG